MLKFYRFILHLCCGYNIYFPHYTQLRDFNEYLSIYEFLNEINFNYKINKKRQRHMYKN